MNSTIDDEIAANPLALQLRLQYGDQIDKILFRVSCQSAGPFGIVDGRTATNEECRKISVALETSFYVDITRDIAQQVADGLRYVVEKMEAEANQLEDDIASGKFPMPT